MVAASATLEACLCGVPSAIASALASSVAPSAPLALGTLFVSLTLLELQTIQNALQSPVLRALLTLAAIAGFAAVIAIQAPLVTATLAHKAVAPLLQPSVGLAVSVAVAVIAIVEAPALSGIAAGIAPKLADGIVWAILMLVAFRMAMGPGATALTKYREEAEAKQRAAAAAAAIVVAPAAVDAVGVTDPIHTVSAVAAH
jgi:hypothetical protein